MKWQWIILSVYFLLVTCIPCTSGSECTGETAIAAAQTTHGDDDSCNEDRCSPFCACSCCHVQCADEIFSRPPAPVVFFTSAQKQGHTESYYSVYWGNIWQPPKCPVV